MIFHAWSWRWRPKRLGQAASGQPSSFTTSLVALPVVFLFEAIEGTSPWSSSCCSNWGHFPSIQPPPPFPGLVLILKYSLLRASKAPQLEAYTSSLDNGWCVPRWWKDVVIVWLTGDSDVVMTWEWWRRCWYWWWHHVRMKFVDHVSGSCELIM